MINLSEHKFFAISLVCFLIFCFQRDISAQVENVPVVHPVYDFLERFEAKGLTPHFSTSSLPLQRKQIKNVLEKLEEAKAELSSSEKRTLDMFLREFEAGENPKAVVFYSPSDSSQVFSEEMIGDRDKFFYHYKDSTKSVNLKPLASIEYLSLIGEDENNSVSMGNLGTRLYGSLGKHFGYYLQSTNGAILSGDRELALSEIHKLKQNVKFADLDSDFDFSESHIAFNWDWFYGSLGRQTRLLGSGLNERIFISANAPPMDALELGARFSNFEYSYLHGSLLATGSAKYKTGFHSQFPQKYVAMHRFALQPSWGEISFWESAVYSKRSVDLAYLNPLSFFKSVEHALRDRDNAIMGGDITVRPLRDFQLKGSFLLDDIKFGEIGEGFWANKTALNVGFLYAPPINIDFGLEYSRIEPYTFTHYDSLNSYTNDEMLIGTAMPPNSEKYLGLIRLWFGGRYPIVLKASYYRHGANVYDEDGALIKNVGGDPMQTKRPEDSERVTFLEGDLRETFQVEIEGGWEIVRNFSLKGYYRFRNSGAEPENIIWLKFTFEDF